MTEDAPTTQTGFSTTGPPPEFKLEKKMFVHNTQLTHNSKCPLHGVHAIRYCPDSGFVPGKSRGTVQGYLTLLKARREEAMAQAVQAAQNPPSSAPEPISEPPSQVAPPAEV